MKKITNFQQRILEALSGKLEGFYLAGGTALSMFYPDSQLVLTDR